MDKILYYCSHCDRYYQSKKRAFDCARKDIEDFFTRHPKSKKMMIPQIIKYNANLIEIN